MRGVFFLWLIFASPVIYCGCGGPRLDVPEPGTYSPLVAVSLGVAASETVPAPAPTPTPDAGKCDNCNGTGRLGDGTVSVPCPVCGGDGRTDKSETNLVPALPPLTKTVPVPDDFVPTKNPAFVEPTKPKPLTEQQKALLRPTYQSNESYSEPRRGLFRRWRGGSTSTGASASGSC